MLFMRRLQTDNRPGKESNNKVEQGEMNEVAFVLPATDNSRHNTKAGSLCGGWKEGKQQCRKERRK